MKKLTILASVAMVACAVNAASFTWGFGGGEYYDQNGAELYTGTAFLYLGTVTASETAFNTSGATLLTYGGFDNNYWAYGNPDADNLSSSASLTATTAGQDYTLILLNKENATSLDGYEGYYTMITGSSAEEAMESNAFADVFALPGERFLAFFAQPGRAVSVPDVLAAGARDAEFLSACLTNSIAFSPEDPREITELKQIVNGIKEELRAYCGGGGDVPGFIRALYARQEEEATIYNRVLNELEGNPDPQLWEERNKSLRELGLRTVARPKTRK